MKLSELTSILVHHGDKPFKILLPGGGEVPTSFHITEVGHVSKHSIDCGGNFHRTDTCQLQAWVGNDEEHRLQAQKLLRILEKAAAGVLPEPAGELPVEIEYENLELSQFPIKGYEIAGGVVVLQLESRHTDCLAKEQCAAPAMAKAGSGAAACCGGGC